MQTEQCFTVAVTGVSLSIGLSVLIIGIPFIVLFLGVTRVLSLVEGRLIEVMLGVRMPRRPIYPQRGQPLLTRIGAMFTDARTWTTLLYQVLMLPLGIVYFTLAVSLVSCGIAFSAAPIVYSLWQLGLVELSHDATVEWAPWLGMPLSLLIGVLLLFGVLHLAKAVAHLHGALAKLLLVQVSSRSG